MIPFLVTIRTADRSPKPNFVGATVKAFAGHRVHLFPTDPDIDWLLREVQDQPVTIHIPDRRMSPNENGIRQVSALEDVAAEWIGLFEDDLEMCQEPVASMSRWLADHDDPQIRVYRFFALPQTPIAKQTATACWCPLKEMRGSQAVAMRNLDARYFAAWASAHPHDWRPKDAPFQDRPERGFDKLIGYWALNQSPKQPYGLVSKPMLVNHVGRHSLLHSHGVRNDRMFAGTGYRYGEASV